MYGSSSWLKSDPSTTRTAIYSAGMPTRSPEMATTPPDTPLESIISPTTSQLPSTIGHTISRVTPTAVESSSRVILSRKPDLTSKESEKSYSQLPTTTFADPEHVSRPEAKTFEQIFYTVRTPGPAFESQGLRTPTSKGTETSDSWIEKESSTSSTYINTKIVDVSSESGRTIKEINDSAGLSRSTDLLSTSLESGKNSSSRSTNSTFGKIPHSEPNIDIEIAQPSTNTVKKREWITRSEYNPHFIDQPDSGAPREISLIDTASTIEKTNFLISKTTWPYCKNRTDHDFSLTTTLRGFSNYMISNSTTKENIIPSKTVISITKERNRETTNLDRIFTKGKPQTTSLLQTTRISNLPPTLETERKTTNKKKRHSGKKSLNIFSVDKSSTPLLAGKQTFNNTDESILPKRGLKDVSRTRPPFEETSSSSSVQSAPGTASPSPVSPTIREGASSPPPPVTSVWTSGLQPATDALGTSVDPGARSTPHVSESTARSLDSTAASTGTGAVHLSGHTAETSVGTTRHAGALDIPSHDRSRRGDPHHANWSPWGYVAGHNSLGHMDHRLQPRDSRGCDSRFHTLSGDDSREQGPGARVQDTSSL
ncbi:mucin-16-like [Myotis yumanensis]|uniref:mucin-16-like n=1 Tax=Myotis yumanensis TaxID=159337 RepID=UPI0038CFBE15